MTMSPFDVRFCEYCQWLYLHTKCHWQEIEQINCISMSNEMRKTSEVRRSFLTFNRKINILTKRWKLFNYFSNHKSSLILSGRVKISHHKRPREFTIAKQRQQTSNGKQVTRIITSNMMSVYCVLRIAYNSFSEDDDTDKRPQWGRRKSAKRTTTTTVSTKHAQNKSKVSRNWFMERMWGIRFSFTPTHSVRSPCIHYN